MSLSPIQSSCHVPESRGVQEHFKCLPLSFGIPSTLTECGRRRPWRLKKWFADLWRGFYNWLSSWLSSSKSESKPIYYKIAASESSGETKFWLFKDGKKTENSLRISCNSAHLNSICFPDSWAIDALPKMIHQIMEDEHIGYLSANSLSSAKLLWRAGLHTSTMLKIGIPGATPKERYFVELVRIACNQRRSLNKKGRSALEMIEEQLVMMLVSDGFNCSGNLSQTFQNEIFFYHHTFRGIDLYGAAKRVKGKQEFETVIAMLDHFMGEVEEAFPHGLRRDPPTVELPFAALCALSTSLDIPFDKHVCQSLNATITFTKEPPYEG